MINFTQSENETKKCYPFEAYFLHFPRDIHYDNFLLAMIVINAVMAVVASCSNAVVIYTISRTPSLQTPSNILILGLAISDLSVGILANPSFCLFKFAELRRNLDFYCYLGKIYTFSTLPFASISFFTLTAITADRFLAVHLHLRYQDIITTKRAGIALGFIWFFGAGIAVYTGMFSNKGIVIICTVCVFAVFVCFNVYFIIRLCLVIRRHSLQIRSQESSAQQTMNMVRYRKSVIVMFLVIGAFILSYVPYGATRILRSLFLKNSYGIRSGLNVSETLVTFNGIMNPIIYCWRIEGIRTSAMSLLWKMCRSNGN